MSWLKKNKDREHFITCRVCGEDLDIRKPRDFFNHEHGSILIYRTWPCWPGYNLDTPNNMPNQKAYFCKKINLN